MIKDFVYNMLLVLLKKKNVIKLYGIALKKIEIFLKNAILHIKIYTCQDDGCISFLI